MCTYCTYRADHESPLSPLAARLLNKGVGSWGDAELAVARTVAHRTSHTHATTHNPYATSAGTAELEDPTGHVGFASLAALSK